MEDITRYGVAHDLTKSPYFLEIDYQFEKLTYIFSSKLYLEKFTLRLYDNREKVSDYISKKFGFKIVNNMLSDIKLYNDIEKRGFLIKGVDDYTCLSTIKLYGENLM